MARLPNGRYGSRLPEREIFPFVRGPYWHFDKSHSCSLSTELFFPRIKRAERKANHSYSTVAVVKNDWSLTSNPECLHGTYSAQGPFPVVTEIKYVSE